MPKIYRTGGVRLSDDVLVIKDFAPTKPRKKAAPPKAVPEGQEVSADGAELEPLDRSEDFEEAYEYEPAATSAVEGEIIQSAMAQAGRILEDAVRNAETTRSNMLAKVQLEAEKMQQDAAENGRRQGFATVVGEVQDMAGKLEQAAARFEGERAAFEVEYEEQMKWLAMEIASKVLAKKVSADDAEMLEMVDKAVQSVRNEAWIRVEVADEMTRLIDALTALYDEQSNIDVSAIPAENGTVHIETPSGVVDASLRTQLANLREYFGVNLTENS